MVDQALFDTNIVIDLLAGIPEASVQFAQYPDRAISVITWMEVMAGVAPPDEARVLVLLARFAYLPLTEAIATRAARVRRETRLKLPDAIILASAQVEARILITRNTRDFGTGSAHIRNPYQL